MKERFYETSRWVWVDQFRQDLRYAWRGMRHKPAFVVTTVSTLAVGLGLAYGAASGLPLPVPAQATIAVLVLAGVAVAALWRPGGRPFEDWAFVLLRYWAMPRLAARCGRMRASRSPLSVMVPACGW